jgi:predicted ferric reductase
MMPYFKSRFFIQSLLAFIGLPLFVWALSGLPMRTVLKESLSILTLLAFFLTMGLFYWSRAGGSAARDLKMSRIVRLHKWMGYTGVSLLLLHPFFLIMPKFFEAGVAPAEALVTILTTTNQGVILGILAWSLILIIGLTALTRNRLPLRYTTWRTLHGLLASVFITIAAWHVIDLGRHATFVMSLLIILMTAGGVQMLLRS